MKSERHHDTPNATASGIWERAPSDGDAREAIRSLAIISIPDSLPLPPTHCLRSCLGDDPTRVESRGCSWLKQVVAGEVSPGQPLSSVCKHGYSVEARRETIIGGDVIIAAVSGPQHDLPPEALLTGADTALNCLESASSACRRIERLTTENEQLADEVLRNYEQLSLMFDFSTQIAGVTHVDAMAKLLFDRCAALLGTGQVYVCGYREGWSRYDVATAKLHDARPVFKTDQFLVSLVDEVREKRIVAVRAEGMTQLAAGPLMYGNRVAVVVALRDSSAGDFASGELRLFESLLTFGGQLLNNGVLHEQLRRLSMEAMRALVSAIDKKDNYTCGHSERVGFFARMVGERLGLPATTLDQLEWSGLLHDVGKIGISERVLNKAGRLTDDQFSHIKQHPRMGYEILKPIHSFADVRKGVLHHHENMDGSGYPDGLRGEAIPLFARIIHVVDVFDALSSRRSYRNALPVDHAIKIIGEEAGRKLDRNIVDRFIEFISDFRAAQPEAFAAMLSKASAMEVAR